MSQGIPSAFLQACGHLWPKRRAACLSVHTGRLVSTCYSWVNGTRTPPPDVLDSLVGFLRRHGAISLALADSLDREGEKARATLRVARGWQIVKERDGPGSIPRDARNRRGRQR